MRLPAAPSAAGHAGWSWGLAADVHGAVRADRGEICGESLRLIGQQASRGHSDGGFAVDSEQ